MAKGEHLKKYRKMPGFEKKRLAGLKKYWARKRKKAKLIPKDYSIPKKSKRVEQTLKASTRTVRLIIYGNNPNTGATELLENSQVTSMQDALGTIIDYLYNGTSLIEIRLQNYE